MSKLFRRNITYWILGIVGVLVLAACGQTPVDPGPVDPGATSTLTVTINGNGSVISDVAGINCTAAGGDTCTASVDDGTEVTLTATADAESQFTGWGGACSGSEASCTVTVNGDTNVTANFSGSPAGDGQSFMVTSASDDAEEFDNASTKDAFRYPAGFNYTSSSDLDLVFDPSHGTTQDVGLRFSSVAIPQGATVESAYIVFTADADNPGNDGPVTVNIAGQANANPDTFVTDPDSQPSGNISGRATTNATVAWQINEPWTAGAEAQSADIAGVVQEIVNMQEWASGNAMAFILTGDDATNYRTAQSFGAGRTAPVLHVTLAAAAPADATPTDGTPVVE